jgi:hypothetical protein
MPLKEPSKAQRLVRLVLYVAIGLIIAALIGIVAVYTPDSIANRLSGGWMALVFYTPIVFGYSVRQYRHLWRRPSFWLTFSGLLLLHLLAFTLVLRIFPVRPFWFAVISAVEMVLITTVLDLVLPNVQNQTHRHDATQDL